MSSMNQLSYFLHVDGVLALETILFSEIFQKRYHLFVVQCTALAGDFAIVVFDFC